MCTCMNILIKVKSVVKHFNKSEKCSPDRSQGTAGRRRAWIHLTCRTNPLLAWISRTCRTNPLLASPTFSFGFRRGDLANSGDLK